MEEWLRLAEGHLNLCFEKNNEVIDTAKANRNTESVDTKRQGQYSIQGKNISFNFNNSYSYINQSIFSKV